MDTHLPTHFPWKWSIRDTYPTYPAANVSYKRLYRFYLGSTFFETVNFVITIQKCPSEPSVSSHPLMHFQQIRPKQGFPHPPLNSSLRDASIFSSNGSTHLVYAYKSHPSAQPLFETFIFIITIQKHPPKPLIFTLIFVYFLQINSLTFRLKDVVSIETNATVIAKTACLFFFI